MIQSTFVSHTAEIGFADALDGAEDLVGREVTAGRVRLVVGERMGSGLVGSVWFSGVLHTGSLLLPTVKVDVVVSPWSAGRIELGVRPRGRLGGINSLRTARFLDAAWAVMPALSASIAEAVRPMVPVAAPTFEAAA